MVRGASDLHMISACVKVVGVLLQSICKKIDARDVADALRDRKWCEPFNFQTCSISFLLHCLKKRVM